MLFQDFAEKLELISNTSGRTEMTKILVELLRTLEPKEVKQAVYLLQGRVAPYYETIEFNFSDRSVLKALKELGDQDPVAMLAKLGDIGLVAQEVVNKQQETRNRKQQAILAIFDELTRLTGISGTGSQEQKQTLFKELMQKVSPVEAKFLARIVTGNLRLGLSDKTILDALSVAAVGDKSMRAQIEHAYGVQADLGLVSELALKTKQEKLAEVLGELHIKVGVPISSKLAEREDSPESVWERFGACIVQPKLDGVRAQIHVDVENGLFQIFSRNMEPLTDMFPDLRDAAMKLKIKSAVFDSEVVGRNFETGATLPFQETMLRRRKNDIDAKSKEIPVQAMCFDIIYLDGEDLTTVPVEDRLEKLADVFSKNGQQRELVKLETEKVETLEDLTNYFVEKVEGGLEGIMIKKCGSLYKPGTRNFDWIKLKANTQSHLVDTVDVIVMGYFHGQGTRAKYGFGSLLTGLYNPEDGKIYSVAKVGSGFTDAQAPEILADMQKSMIGAQPPEYVVTSTLIPDVWLRPDIVMEVIADEITRSPAHTVARDIKADFEKDPAGKGLSLRFPRIKIWKRDKRFDQSTTPKELLRLLELRYQRAHK